MRNPVLLRLFWLVERLGLTALLAFAYLHGGLSRVPRSLRPMGDRGSPLALRPSRRRALAGGEVFFPAGRSADRGPLPPWSGLTLTGPSRVAAGLHVTSGTLFAPESTVSSVVFQRLTLSTAGGHLIDLGARGALAMSAFRDCALVSYVPEASLMYQRGSGDVVEVLLDGCDCTTGRGPTVPAFDPVNHGGAVNANSWVRCRAKRRELHRRAVLADRGNRWLDGARQCLAEHRRGAELRRPDPPLLLHGRVRGLRVGLGHRRSLGRPPGPRGDLDVRSAAVPRDRRPRCDRSVRRVRRRGAARVGGRGNSAHVAT